MANWSIETLTVNGGFLSDLSLRFPTGLICVIGPRGSGKSTLAEAIRLVLAGLPPASAKSRVELCKANLSGSVASLSTKTGTERGGFTIRRTYGQPAVLSAPDSRPVTAVDLDRGTFLPIDAYGSLDIEGIADESLGSKRRSLLDDLRPSEMQQIHLTLGGYRRDLEANADKIRAAQRTIGDLAEQIEELGDVDSRLAALPVPSEREGTPEFQSASTQRLLNEKEASNLAAASQRLAHMADEFELVLTRGRRDAEMNLTIEGSTNSAILDRADRGLRSFWSKLDQTVAVVRRSIEQMGQELDQIARELQEAHSIQDAAYLSLQHKNQEAVKAFEARAAAAKEVSSAAALRQQQSEALDGLHSLQAQRKAIKSAYLLARDKISELREQVAKDLEAHAGNRVRIRVKRHADLSEYQQKLFNALHGSKLKNQEELLRNISSIRPEDLALILRENDFEEFEMHTSFGKERGRKILDALQQNIDSLELEVLPIDDRIIIELNVSSDESSNFKDASELSRGQKCTAILPILLARRDTPLIIDQPEDNLDNHFIYETVVESIRRLKSRRQMIFITHNANIPVLGEADLVVVMNSDGRRGYVEKAGTVDDCRNEIIDLLEGGEEAFDLRKKRYGSQ